MGEIVSRLAAVLLYAGLQGFVLAGLARLMGDKRPTYDGRLTANPFAQLSVWGAAMAALFAVSWPRSLWYAPSANRWGRAGTALVVVLGLVAMVAVIPLVQWLQVLAVWLPRNGAFAVLLVLDQLQAITLASVVLNLLPLPGLVGGGVLQAIWPNQERRLRRAEPLCMALVIAAIVAGFWPPVARMLLPYLGVG